MFEVDDALPAELDGARELEEPDLMALADAEIEEILPAAPASDGQGPPVASDILPMMSATDALDDPLDVDSSLQSGGLHRPTVGKESPWAADSRAADEPLHRSTASAAKGPTAPPKATPAEEVVKPPAKRKQPPKKKPPAATPPKKPKDSDELDQEFGSFFEDLQ